jgi:hypothetical protein
VNTRYSACFVEGQIQSVAGTICVHSMLKIFACIPLNVPLMFVPLL